MEAKHWVMVGVFLVIGICIWFLVGQATEGSKKMMDAEKSRMQQRAPLTYPAGR